MDIVTLCIALVIFQPFIVYFAFYKNTGLPTQYNAFFQSFLVLAPSLAFFYLDQYWHALSLLVGVTLVGVLLAKLVNRKASHPIDRDALILFAVAWLILFGLGHYGAYFFADSGAMGSMSEVSTSPKGIYSALQISLYYLAAMLVLIFIRIVEKKCEPREELSGVLLLVLSVIGGAFPAMGDYFILSTVLNMFILYLISGVIVRSDDDSPAGGAIGYMYAFLFTMGVGLCLIYKGGVWWYSVVS